MDIHPVSVSTGFVAGVMILLLDFGGVAIHGPK